MCNIAGYVGSKRAAPILIEMMLKQEGWDAGYYTGIATAFEGKLYTDKVVGDTQKLLEQTDSANCPGNVGILHGRSKAGGDARWAQPFVGATGKIAYMVNGTVGAFAKCIKTRREEIYMTLKAAGYRCSSCTEGKVGGYGVYPDGCSAHASDVACQQIARYVDCGWTTPAAMGKAYCEIPCEVVGLALNVDEPDRISWVRINYPMFLGFASHGTYMATTPMAFPNDVTRITLLDPLSCGSVLADHYESKPILDFPGTVAPITPSAWKACYEAVIQNLSEREMDHDELDLLVKPLLGKADCVEEATAEYAILYELQKQGRLLITKSRVPGSFEGLDAPKFRAKLK